MDGAPGWDVVELGEVASTQDEVRNRLSGGACPPLAVSATVQRSGRGRRGNRWESPAGGLWLSFALTSPIPADPFIGLIVAAAASEAVASLLPEEPAKRLRLKWPNDLVIGDRKWGGVIAEVEPARHEGVWLIFGVGLNLRIPEEQLPPTPPEALVATSILAEFDQSPSPATVLPRILSTLDRRLAEDRVVGGRARTVERLTPLLATIGRRIRWASSESDLDGADPRLHEGRAIGVANDGGLEVELDDPRSAISRRIVLRAGEIKHLRDPDLTEPRTRDPELPGTHPREEHLRKQEGDNR